MQDDLCKVILRRGRDAAVRRGHLWVFSRAIAGIEGEPEDGALVRVIDSDGGPLGLGHYQHSGSIRVRILSRGDSASGSGFWVERIRSALETRRIAGLVGNGATNAYRLVHCEGDFLPGLVIDWYDGHAMVQCHSAGMEKARPAIVAAMREVFGEELKSCEPAEAGGCVISENGRQFRVDWTAGQKTGFFLDQRDNRALAGRYAAGRNVLDVFCYSGGFSVNALAGGAKRVCAVDSSERALELARGNVELNGFAAGVFETVKADAMDYVRTIDSSWDMVVLDPPAFAKRLSARHSAIQAYRRLNGEVLRRMPGDGLLFTFSCSQAVTPDLFRGAVMAGAIDSGRDVRILHQLSQGADHPVNLAHPESEYLKGLALLVEGR